MLSRGIISLALLATGCLSYDPLTSGFPSSIDPLTATVESLQKFLTNGTVTSVQLVSEYLARIDKNNHKGLNLRSVIETAPESSVLAIAAQADYLRANGTVLGPFHGIPILLKDNVGTDPELGLNTTAGSYALLPQYAGYVKEDATIAKQLRAAGAIILGKTNLSEFANFKGNITNGWSARGGQTQTPYVLGGPRVNGGDPCGSSSGSGSAIASGFAAIAIGTETDGSIVCPSNRHALFGLKPSVGVASRAGIVPISHNQDSPGPMGKSTYDVAAMLSIIASVEVDPRDNATEGAIALADYTQFLTTTFDGITLGIPNRDVFFNATFTSSQQIVDDALAAIKKIGSFGAVLLETPIPSMDDIVATGSGNETIVLDFDFKVDLASYLSGLSTNTTDDPIRTLADVINFNDEYRELEFATDECCQQTLIESVQTTGYESEEYLEALRLNRDILGRQNGLNAVFAKFKNLTAIVLPSEGYSTTPAAIAGFPIATVPLGYYNDSGAPFGLAFIGKQYDEASLIRVMSAFEANFPARKVPTIKLN